MRRLIRLTTAVAGMGLAALGGLVIGAAVPDTAPDEAAVGAMVRRYILAHPELIPEALARLRIAPERTAIETPFAGAWAGNPKADVTLVVFSDYNCPYCRVTAPVITRLLASDPRLKVVWRELPVLGADSDALARVALAAAKQGRYLAFNRALFAGGSGAIEAARAAGLDLARLAADRNAPDVSGEIAANLALARRLEVTATPFFVIGNRTYAGAINQDALAAAIAEARKGGD